MPEQGAQPDTISYGNTIKRAADIAFAHRAGITLFAADAAEEIAKIAALAGLSMPVTLLWGGGDQLMPDAHFEWFARHLPLGSRVERLRDAGHAPYLERPGAVAQAIRDARAASLRVAA